MEDTNEINETLTTSETGSDKAEEEPKAQIANDELAEGSGRVSEPEPNAADQKVPKKGKRRQGKWIWGAILFLLLALFLGGFLGYKKGIARRIEKQSQQEMQMIEAQLALYFSDMGQGKYENAYARLDWIKRIKPGFPGIDDMINEVSQKMTYIPEQPASEMNLGLPTLEQPIEPGETPTPKPTLDIAQAEALYTAIQQAVADQDWNTAVSKILEIKEKAFDYKRILVDGYYFIALRNRGISRIWTGELEQGMYDLSVVNSLGALDNDANGAYQWASTYMTATTYWDSSWASAVEAFGALYAQSPYFAESGGMTVAERYRIALYKRGDEFAQQEDWCTAADYYARSIEVGLNLDIQVTATAYRDYCANPPSQSTPEPPVGQTPTPDGDLTPEVPTEEPTEEPTEAPAP